MRPQRAPPRNGEGREPGKVAALMHQLPGVSGGTHSTVRRRGEVIHMHGIVDHRELPYPAVVVFPFAGPDHDEFRVAAIDPNKVRFRGAITTTSRSISHGGALNVAAQLASMLCMPILDRCRA